MNYTASFDTLSDALDFKAWLEDNKDYVVTAVENKDKGHEGLMYYEVSYTSK